jgi:hypothetical protein
MIWTGSQPAGTQAANQGVSAAMAVHVASGSYRRFAGGRRSAASFHTVGSAS